jgi:hypothetical protein
MSLTDRIPVSVERVGNFLADIEQLYDVISRKADEYFAGRGSVSGHDVDDWLSAEKDLVVKPAFKLSRQNGDFVVEMALPDAGVSGLLIRLTPNQMLISSKPDDSGRRVFRIVRFPETIDWASIDAVMIGNKLRVVAEVVPHPENRSYSHFA